MRRQHLQKTALTKGRKRGQDFQKTTLARRTVLAIKTICVKKKNLQKDGKRGQDFQKTTLARGTVLAIKTYV